MKKPALLAITALLTLFLLTTGCTDDDNGEEEEELEPAPGFSLESVDGDTYSLSGLSGKVVILDFMYVDCASCDDEMGELKKVYNNYDDNDVVIITIDIWPDEDNETELRDFGEEHGDDWVYAFDDGDVWDNYKRDDDGVPKVFIITQDGKIAYEHAGLTTYATLSAEIDKLL